MTFTVMPDGLVVLRLKNKSAADLAGLLHREGRAPVATERLSR